MVPNGSVQKSARSRKSEAKLRATQEREKKKKTG
jgi:hypothetical protein